MRVLLFLWGKKSKRSYNRIVGFPFGMILLMEGGAGNPSAEGGDEVWGFVCAYSLHFFIK